MISAAAAYQQDNWTSATEFIVLTVCITVIICAFITGRFPWQRK